MTPGQPMTLDDLVWALSSRPGIPGLTPVTRSASEQSRDTALVLELLLKSLRRQATLAR
ncbi:MAG: hypothetical protein OEQ74_04520 [Gammaproteobacteria bacterium]|nr:hypothetical protein [Gammaproteobacteria bacterium]